FFLIVAGERHEIDALFGLLRRHNGSEHGGLAITGKHRAIGLPGYFAGLENELAPAPIKFLTMDVKHWFRLLSWFSAMNAMSKIERACAQPLPSPACGAGQGGAARLCFGHSVQQSCHGVLAFGCRAFFTRPNIPTLPSAARGGRAGWGEC